MKFFFITALVIASNLAQAAKLNMTDFDQLKLAEFLGTLPDSVRDHLVEDVVAPKAGKKVKTAIPVTSTEAFAVRCERTFFNESRFASRGSCQVDLDLTHAEVSKRNDEVRVKILDRELSEALWSKILHGKEVKEFRSAESVYGMTYEGKKGYIFDYFLRCTQQECIMKFSAQSLQ